MNVAWRNCVKRNLAIDVDLDQIPDVDQIHAVDAAVFRVIEDIAVKYPLSPIAPPTQGTLT